MALWGDEVVTVDLVAPIVECFGSGYRPEQGNAVVRALVSRGLVRRAGKGYVLSRPARPDDATIAALLAAEFKTEGHVERSAGELARGSLALASLGLFGRSASDRLEALGDSPVLARDYLLGRLRFTLRHGA